MGEMATTILIVEDDGDLRYLIRRVIEAAEGFEIAAEASDGIEALATWRSMLRSAPPDVVLLDQGIPGMSGLDVAREVLAERLEQIVILFTAFLDPRLEDQARRMGVTACIEKFDMPGLPDLLRQLPGTPRPSPS